MIQPVGRKETTLAAFSRQKEFAMRRTKICLRFLRSFVPFVPALGRRIRAGRESWSNPEA